MSEIATVLKDGLIEDGEEEAYRYMADVAELSNTEAEYFGLDMEQYRAATGEDADSPTAPSITGSDYSPAHPWDAPGMSASDFILQQELSRIKLKKRKNYIERFRPTPECPPKRLVFLPLMRSM